MRVFDLFHAHTIAAVAPQRLRQEVFSLGGRHRGDPLAGALHELKDPRLSAEQRVLLKAVVLHLSSPGTGTVGAAVGARRPLRFGLNEASYIAAIVAILCLIAAFWSAVR